MCFSSAFLVMTMVFPLHHRPHRLLLDDTNGTKPRSSFTNEADFDTSMVIILAALLCALICALGLNSIVRCAFRCSRRFAFETPGETAARLAVTGMRKSALRQIPVAVYSSGINLKATDCPICLGEFVDGEKIRVLPKCNHGFHVKCVDTWLLSHSSCPTCRQSLLELETCSEAPPSMEAGVRQHGNSSGGQSDVPVAADEEARCKHQLLAEIRTATTPRNKGKKFYGCPLFFEGDDCKFFHWVEPNIDESQSNSACLHEELQLEVVELLRENRELRMRMNSNKGCYCSMYKNLLLIVIVMLIYFLLKQ